MNRWRIPRDPLALAFLICLLVMILISVFGPILLSLSPDEQDFTRRLESPSSHAWLGRDSLGRDLLARVLQGFRFSLLIGFLSTGFALLLGTITGAIAGFYRGRAELLVLGIIDFFSVFPSLLLAILISLAMGRGFGGILISISIVAWVQHARLVRVQVIQTKQMEYIESARAMGLKPLQILWRHVLPNILGPILVSASAQIPANVMAESFLSFLGLGVEPPFASLGTLASEGSRMLRSHPHLLFSPAAVLMLTLLAAQYLGDWIRDQSTDTSLR